MPSSFTWLDHSDRERRRVLEAIDRFKESDTRDELGFASIRDGFADMFFPGTSVLQTRARYFLFIPWLYLDAERRRIPAEKLAAHVRKAEIALIDPLLASEDPAGTIGRVARATLKRLPTSLYWLGLSSWKVRLFSGSVDDYHRSIDRFHATARGSDDDGDVLDGGPRRNWHPELPAAPSDFPNDAVFRLRPEESQFLTDQIRFAWPGTLLEFLVRRSDPVDVDFVWDHAQLADFPPEVRTALAHAQLFAESMQGAALLYNLMLAESLPKGDTQGERVEHFRTRITEWCVELSARGRLFAEWDRQAFWSLICSRATVKQPTQIFVENWLRLAPWNDPKAATNGDSPRQLVRTREAQLKGPRARLGNPRALELWGGESGSRRLDFRWRNVRRLIADIRGHEMKADDNDA